MKHLKYIATIATGSVLLSSFAPSAFALDMGNFMGNGVGNIMNNPTSVLGGTSSAGSTDNSADDENIANTDSFSVKTYEIKKGNFSIGNTDTIEIDGTLYVYGNLDVSNADSFKVTGKLKVTGDLIVGNGNLENSGRIYVGGKKKFSNGSLKWAGAKVTADFAKYDPILRADLEKEEEVKVQDLIASMKKKVESLKQDIKAAVEKNERIEPIKDKIRHEKEVFFTEMKQYIQEEDMAKFEKLSKEDNSNTEGFLAGFKHTGEPSEKLRAQISAIVSKIPAATREAKLTMLVAKLETMLTTAKLSDKKKLLISQVKEALQDELDNLSGVDTINGLLGEEPATTGATTTTTTTSTSGSGAANTTSSASGSTATTSTTSGAATNTSANSTGSTVNTSTSGSGTTMAQ